MKRNGFTLIEILAVVVILGIIVAIGFGVYYGLGSRSKQRIYEAKVELIETEAEKWAEAVNLKNNVTIIVDRLIFDGFLTADEDNGDVVDTRDSETIMNCYEVEIKLTNNNTEATMYERNAKDCSDIKASQEADKYITIEAQTSPDGDKIEWTEEVTGILDWTKEDVELIAGHEFDTVDSITWKIDTKDNQCNGQENCVIAGVDGETYLPYVTVTIVTEGKTYIKRVLVRIDKQNPICETSGGTGTSWVNASNIKNGVSIIGKCDDQYGSGCVTPQISVGPYTTNLDTSMTPGTVWDKVGNFARCDESQIRIDVNAPTCVSSGGSSGWYNKSTVGSGVVITGTCTDTGPSGCATPTVTKVIKTNTNSTATSPGSVKDNAGNTAVCPGNRTVRIDINPPTCTVSGGNGAWTTSNQTVTGTCSDTGGSGCTGNISYTYSSSISTSVAGAAGNGVGGTIKDGAGNTTTCSANKTVYIDKTGPYPPTISQVEVRFDAASTTCNGAYKVICDFYGNEDRDRHCTIHFLANSTAGNCRARWWFGHADWGIGVQWHNLSTANPYLSGWFEYTYGNTRYDTIGVGTGGETYHWYASSDQLGNGGKWLYLKTAVWSSQYNYDVHGTFAW